MKKIAIIGANEPLIPFYKQASKLGYYLVGIAWEKGAVCKKYCDKFYPISFRDKEKVLEVCKNESVDGVLSFSLESALPTVIYVSQSLGLTSNTEECLRLTENKYTMRNAFKCAGIPVPQYYLVANQSELNAITINYPAIVKPVDSGGSQGINKINSEEELLQAYLYAVNYSPTKQVIVEEYIDGREFSVEYISHDAKHYNLQITDKVTSGTPHFIEMSHHQPANINKELAEAIKRMVEKALTALKIENSASHTEIKYNSRGELYIIETGARMGGDYITSDLVRLSTGYDMVKGVIELSTGEFKEPQLSSHFYSGVYFYSKLSPYIGNIIRNHDRYKEIVEWEIDESELMEARSNADRKGYFLYQSEKGRLEVE